MKSRIVLPALLVAGLFVVDQRSNAQARIFGGGGCCEPSCCAAEPSCCAAAAPSCAAEPSCCAPAPAAQEVLPREALPPSPLLQAELLRSGLRSDLRRCPLVRCRALLRCRAELLRSGTVLLHEEVPSREALPPPPLLQADLLCPGL